MKQLYIYICLIFLSQSLVSAEDTLIAKIHELENKRVDHILEISKKTSSIFTDNCRLAIIQCQIDGFETFLRESSYSELNAKTEARIHQFLLSPDVSESSKEYYIRNIGSLLSEEQAFDLYRKLHMLHNQDFTVGTDQDLIDIENGKTPETIIRQKNIGRFVCFLNKRSLKVPSKSFSRAFDIIDAHPDKLSVPVHNSYPGYIAKSKGIVVHYE